MSLDLYFQLVTLTVLLFGGALVLGSRLNTPFRGLQLLLTCAVLTPFELASGLNLCFLLAAFLCGNWLLRIILQRQEITLDESRIVAAALAFLAIAAISFVVGQYPWFPTAGAPMRAQLGGLALFLLSGGVFLFAGHHIRSLAELRRLTWLFIGTGALAVVTSIVNVFEFLVGPVAVTDAASIGSGFWIWIVAISLSQGLCNRELSTRARLASVSIGVFALARGLLLAFSWASGWLPPLLAACVILLLRFPKFAIGSALLLAAPTLLIAGRAMDSLMGGESYSWMTRLEAARVTWQLIERSPWFGFGPANYYQYTLLFPILGWWVRFSTHNNYLDLLAQTGIVGLLVFGWFVVEVFRLALRLRARVPSGFARAYVVGAIAGLAGSLVAGLLADWIVPFAYNIGLRGFRSSVLFWFFLGGLLALKRITAAAPAPAAVRATRRPRPLIPARI